MQRSTLTHLTLEGLAVVLATVSLMIPGLGLLTAPAAVFGAVGLGMHLRDALADNGPVPARADQPAPADAIETPHSLRQ